MNENTQGAIERPFLRSLLLLARHWRFLLVCFLAGAVVSALIALLMPNQFRATATFLPPQKQSGLFDNVASGLSTTLRSFGFSRMATGGSGVYSYLAILESRQMGERIVAAFDLKKVYDVSSGSMERTLKILAENTEFTIEEEGQITVSVWDADAKRAADMANAFVQYLNEINTDLSAREARANRQFIEQQYNATLAAVRSIEDSFVVFQKRTKIFSLPDQSKAALTAAAGASAQLLYQQVAVAVAEKMYGSDDADVRLAQEKLKEMRKTVGEMSASTGFGDLLPAMKDMPKEGMEYMRLYRDYEIYSKFLAMLMPMYQQAKVDENRQALAVVTLDRAVVPERKDRPKRSIIVAVSALSLLVLGLLFLFVRERLYFYRSAHPAEWAALRESFSRRKSAQ